MVGRDYESDICWRFLLLASHILGLVSHKKVSPPPSSISPGQNVSIVNIYINRGDGMFIGVLGIKFNSKFKSSYL